MAGAHAMRFEGSTAAPCGSASFIPLAGPFLATGIDVASPSVREAYLSTADQIESMTANSSTDTSRSAAYYNMALGVQAANGGQLPENEGWDRYRNPNGQLRTITEISQEDPDFNLMLFETRVRNELASTGMPIEAFFSSFDNARSQATG